MTQHYVFIIFYKKDITNNSLS